MTINQKSKKNQKTLTKYPVYFAYLFGSEAKNTTSFFSDIDIAIYLDPKLDKTAKNQTISDIREDLEKNLQMPQKVDIVCLNQELPFVLLRNIVYEGKLLYSQNELKRINWESKALTLWLDWQPYHNQFAQATLTQSRL